MQRPVLAVMLSIAITGVLAQPVAGTPASAADELFLLSQQYAAGAGVPVDLNRAAVLLQRAADLGHAEAQLQLGRCYLAGMGVLPNAMRGAILVRQAAEQGLTEAMREMERLHQEGFGVSRNTAQAAMWGARAAAADAQAISALVDDGAR